SACRLAEALSLTGLNSADFMVDGDDFWILEINPRPGGTLDIFEPDGGSLFSLHMAACTGDLIAEIPRLDGAKASAIFYAERDVIAPARFQWPDWAADRPNAGIAIKAGEPLCTVHASARPAMGGQGVVKEALSIVHTWMHDGAHPNTALTLRLASICGQRNWSAAWLLTPQRLELALRKVRSAKD